MCIGIPMQVLACAGTFADCVGREGAGRVGTQLVAPVSVGDWLLVFLGEAQQIITAQRAQEVNATLDLVTQAMQGQAVTFEAAFDLPSRMSLQEVQRLSSATSNPNHAKDIS